MNCNNLENNSSCQNDKCSYTDSCENNCIPAKNISDILTSIALEEAALSNILNAESEKIQKAVQLSDSVQELLCVNASVLKTIDAVTSLEVVLLSKLKVALEAHVCTHPPMPINSVIFVSGNVLLPCGCAAKNASVTLSAKHTHITRTDNCGRFCFPSIDVDCAFSVRASCNNLCSNQITIKSPLEPTYSLLLCFQ